MTTPKSASEIMEFITPEANPNLRAPLPRLVTAAWLASRGACRADREAFAQEWPGGAELTPENLSRAYALGLNVGWLGANVLTDSAWQVYEAAARAARDAYEAAVRPAWQVYEAAERAEWDAYEAAVRPAWQVYEAAVRAAWGAFSSAERAAWQVSQAGREAHLYALLTGEGASR